MQITAFATINIYSLKAVLFGAIWLWTPQLIVVCLSSELQNIRRFFYLLLLGPKRRNFYCIHLDLHLFTRVCVLLARLSPLYLMVGLLTEIFTSYIVDVSKFWVHDRTDLNCQRFVKHFRMNFSFWNWSIFASLPTQILVAKFILHQ